MISGNDPRPSPPPLEGVLAAPGDGPEPVFAAPWEAQAFAIVIGLHKAGHFAWSEFVRCLADEIAGGAGAGPRDGSDYYRHWLRACERLLTDRGMIDEVALLGHYRAAAEAARHRRHAAGAPAPAHDREAGT